ncbi:MAG TPA: hypothetical protein VMN35_06015 [Gaiellaceae bacterium]|nr:hypothetical protein [Gaiellaceae bacterium]
MTTTLRPGRMNAYWSVSTVRFVCTVRSKRYSTRTVRAPRISTTSPLHALRPDGADLPDEPSSKAAGTASETPRPPHGMPLEALRAGLQIRPGRRGEEDRDGERGRRPRA